MNGKHSDEIVIAGAGLAGMPLACTLGQAGVSVTLVEAKPLSQLISSKFDGRTTAVARSSKQMLGVLGIWDAIEACAQPILDIRVADGGSPFFVHYTHEDVGSEALGWIVENGVLRTAMLERLKTLGNVKLLDELEVSDVNADRGFCSVELSDGSILKTRLLVGADGRNSLTRRLSGIETKQWSYNQHAIVCTVRHDLPHRGIAHEHFLPSGPFAILPMLENRSSIVWTEHSSLAPHMMQLDRANFLEELQKRFGQFLGPLELEGPIGSYPLGSMTASSYIGPRVALVAEAAHTIHPIAGQGINIGWRDVAALSEVVINSLRLGLDPGSESTLQKYQQWRRPDNISMTMTTDILNRLFSNRVPPLVAARNLGLGLVQRLPGVKKILMRHAMGELGKLPRLIQGLKI